MATQLLTGEDLDALGTTEGSDAQLLSTARRLVQAVDEDRIADPADIGYALSIAADLPTRADDLATAIELAERAVAADLVHVGTEYSRGSAGRAAVRRQPRGRGVPQLEPLRALMTVDALAVALAAEALEASAAGRAGRRLADRGPRRRPSTVGEAIPQEQEEALDHAAAVIYELVSLRHRIRGDLGLEHDDYDELSDDLKAQIEELNHPGPLLFWPEQQFAALWPDGRRRVSCGARTGTSTVPTSRPSCRAGPTRHQRPVGARSGPDASCSTLPTAKECGPDRRRRAAGLPRLAARRPSSSRGRRRATGRAGAVQARSTRSAACPGRAADLAR